MSCWKLANPAGEVATMGQQLSQRGGAVLTEEQLQRTIADYLNLMSRSGRFRWFHVPNGGHISRSLGARRKRMGARAGVPDILIETKGGKVIEIELKTDKGRLSRSQQEWQRESYHLGVPYFVVRSVEEMEAVLRGAGLTWD